MSKPKLKAYNRINDFVNEFGNTIFLADKSVLHCKICYIKVSAEKRFTVIHHIIKTVKHIQRINRQQLLKLTKNNLNLFLSQKKKQPFM